MGLFFGKTPLNASEYKVPLAGLEPALCRQKRILSPVRLPIPPQRLVEASRLKVSAAAKISREEILGSCLE
jgi:hypothetical protein